MATFVVNTGLDDTNSGNTLISLREAIDLAAASGGADTIVFDPSLSEITLSGVGGPLVIAAGNAVTINGDGDGDGQADVLINGNGATLFNIAAGGTLQLQSLALMGGGYASGAQGSAGSSGSAGSAGVDGSVAGSNGTDGGAGGTGTSGGNGEDTAGLIFNAGSLTIVRTSLGEGWASGGSGGYGGAGGTGGTGGNGAAGLYQPFAAGGNGGNGGHGGDGGTGGTGGNGGNAAGAILNTAGATLSLVDSAFTTRLVHEGHAYGDVRNVGDLYAAGGRGGQGGASGQGGRGGNGGTGANGAYVYSYYGSYRYAGGNGGTGGNGGNGGTAGNGGNGGSAAGAILNFGTISGTAAVRDTSGLSAYGGYRGSPGYNGYGGYNYGSGGNGGYGTPYGYSGSSGSAGSSGTPGSYGTNGTGTPGIANAGSGSGTVTTSDSLIYLHAGSLQITEGDSGTTTVTFHINRIGDFVESTGVTWTVAGGTGLTGADFTGGVLPTGNALFLNSATTQVSVSFEIVTDSLVELDENFTITLSGLIDVAGGPTQGLGTSVLNGTIVSDDGLYQLFATSALSGTPLAESMNFATVMTAATTGQFIHVADSAFLGSTVQTLSVSKENITLVANAPYLADITLATGIAAFSLSGSSASRIFGNASANSLTGGSGANRLEGLGGNDTLNGGTGADTLVGGLNDDTYRVDNAGDVVTEAAGQGTDTVTASVSYVLGSGVSVEQLSTSNAAGVTAINLTGNALAQRITGNAGVNTLNDGGGTGVDTLEGLAGDDTYRIGNAGTQILETAGQGNDFAFSAVNYTLATGVSIERLGTISGAAVTPINLTGNALAQLITGNAGVNTLNDGGGAGADTMQGFAGDDTYRIGNAATQIVEAAAQGNDSVEASVSYTLGSGVSIERLATSSAAGVTAINLTGNALAQLITGNAGVNTLNDGGGAGADTMEGFAGDDIYRIGNAGTQIVETAGQGNDFAFSAVNYTLATGVSIERLGTISAAAATAINLTGNALAQIITGNAGVNTLNDGGGAGADTLYGYGGDDIYRIGNAGTQIVETAGQGNDFAFSAVNYTLATGVSIERLGTISAAAATAINLTGNTLAQLITGNAGVNTLNDGGGAGADTLQGFAGDDIYRIGNAGTQILETAGQGNDFAFSAVNYTLATGVSIERLGTISGAAVTPINLTGNELAQLITGNAGVNRLNGAAGADTLQGAGGADVFVFNSTLGGGNIDRITDFAAGTDRIELENAIFAGLAAGPLAAVSFAANLTGLATSAAHRIIYETDSGALWFDADGTGAAARVQFATLNAALAVTSADFLVV